MLQFVLLILIQKLFKIVCWVDWFPGCSEAQRDGASPSPSPREPGVCGDLGFYYPACFALLSSVCYVICIVGKSERHLHPLRVSGWARDLNRRKRGAPGVSPCGAQGGQGRSVLAPGVEGAAGTESCAAGRLALCPRPPRPRSVASSSFLLGSEAPSHGRSLLPSGRKEVRALSVLLLFSRYLWLKIPLKPKWHALRWRVRPPLGWICN